MAETQSGARSGAGRAGGGPDDAGHSRTGLSAAQVRREVFLFLSVGVLLGVSGGLFDPTFNNYLRDTFHPSAGARGWLEFPREFPGFLTAAMFGWLFFMVEARIAVVAALLTAIGTLALSHCVGPSQWYPMVGCLLVLNAGSHLMMPLQNAIGMSLAEEGKEATLLGRIGSIGTVGYIAGAGFIWLNGTVLHLPYARVFLIAATASLGAAAVLGMMRAQPRKRKPAAFVYRREYRLFYLLNILFGARKQVFITFGFWVLVNVFHQEPASFAKLLIASAVIGIFLKPALGRLIDRLGERPVLVADAVLMVFVCLGYGSAEHLGLGRHAVNLVFACYMMDQILFATGMARATYLNKIAVLPDDISPTLSLGISMDHAVSMTVPVLGGWIWNRYGYPYVFVGAAAIALLNGFAAAQMRVPKREPAALAEK